MSNPHEFGMVHNVVAVLRLDLEALEFICYALPRKDEFTKDCFKALEEVEKNCNEKHHNRHCQLEKDHEGLHYFSVTGRVYPL